VGSVGEHYSHKISPIVEAASTGSREGGFAWLLGQRNAKWGNIFIVSQIKPIEFYHKLTLLFSTP
jgi:hypothetical protein